MIKAAGLLCLLTVAAVPPDRSLSPVSASEVVPKLVEPARKPPASIRVMTYNVHGLPALLRKRDTGSLHEIGQHFRHLRMRGRHPHIVVLQEAFTDEAKAIGRMGGYAYVVDGPSAQDPVDATPGNATSQWWAGEGWGKHVGSGLQVLSDFPVVATVGKAFPDAACAGFDCLANKGILSVSLRIPGQSEPLDIVTTHFNSRRASGVSHTRSNAAFGRQTATLVQFLRRTRDPRRPRILAGDFNIGRDAVRQRLFREAISDLAEHDRFDDALQFLQHRERRPLPECVREAQERGKDLELWSNGSGWRLKPVRADAPFGHEPDGTMLSDHVGYQTEFRIIPGAIGRVQ